MTQLTLLQQVPIERYKPRLYLNGFPKAGLHLLEQMAQVLVTPSQIGQSGNEWLGTFKHRSWTNEPKDLRRFLWRLSCLRHGQYAKGHCGYWDEIERLMWYANIGQVFVYRDLRDVAVSVAHHVTSDDPQLAHEHKSFFQMMEFDDVLLAVIKGIGPYPGVIERWERYAPWLEVDWILKVKYEELVAGLELWAENILHYAVSNATRLLETRIAPMAITLDTERELVKRMVEAAQDTGKSVTYRKGQPGEWREAFKPEHVKAFKKMDRAGWLKRLGYEESKRDW